MISASSIATKLDSISGEIEGQHPMVALFLDKVCDTIEKNSFYSPMGWQPGFRVDPSLPGRTMYEPGKRLPTPGDENTETSVCHGCGRKIVHCPGINPVCPNCGTTVA